MIGSLRGRLTFKQAPQIVIDCDGVGYEVETPMSTFLDLPATGEDLFIYIHHLVREDAQILYGFMSEAERSLFRALLKISGVGAKMALAILSSMGVGDFQRCVEHEDAAMLVRIPGVGKKTAERLIIEMRDRIAKLPSAPGQTRIPAGASPRGEAMHALIALGYRPKEVNRLIGSMDVANSSAEDIIRRALQQAAK